MGDLGWIARQAGAKFLGQEHGVDEGQHLRRRAEGGVQFDALRIDASRAEVVEPGGAAGQEQVRIGTLERIDRLFDVANHEQGTRRIPHAGTGTKLNGQGLNDVPLLKGSVLRLVEQQMFNAAIEFVEHPHRILAGIEQGRGALDQIVKVEHTAARLFLGIGADIGCSKDQGIDGGLRYGRGGNALAGLGQDVLLQ